MVSQKCFWFDLIWFDLMIWFELIWWLSSILFDSIRFDNKFEIWDKNILKMLHFKKSGSQGDGPSISIWPTEHNSFLPIVRDPVRKNQLYSPAKSWIGFWAFEFWLAQYKVYVPPRFNWNFSFIRCQKSRNFRVNWTYRCPTRLWTSIFQFDLTV